jgi:hypothetical protein
MSSSIPAPGKLLSKLAGSCRRQRPPFKLALATEVRLEFGEHPEHVQEALAGIGDWGSSLRAQRGLGATSPAVHA